jgi:hypothetical protein
VLTAGELAGECSWFSHFLRLARHERFRNSFLVNGLRHERQFSAHLLLERWLFAKPGATANTTKLVGILLRFRIAKDRSLQTGGAGFVLPAVAECRGRLAGGCKARDTCPAVAACAVPSAGKAGRDLSCRISTPDFSPLSAI